MCCEHRPIKLTPLGRLEIMCQLACTGAEIVQAALAEAKELHVALTKLQAIWACVGLNAKPLCVRVPRRHRPFCPVVLSRALKVADANHVTNLHRWSSATLCRILEKG